MQPTEGDAANRWDQAPTSADAAIPLARPVQAPVRARPRDEILLPDTSPKRAWIDLALFSAALLLFSIVFESALWSAVGPDDPNLAEDVEIQTGRRLLVPTLIVRAAAAVAILWAILRYRGQRPGSLGLTRTRLIENVLLGPATACVAYLFVLLMAIGVWWLWPEITGQWNENVERIMTLVPHLHPALFAVIAVVVGVYEELVFRGFLMTRLRRATGSWTAAVILSTAIFTILHAPAQAPIALAAITIVSLVLSFVTIWRRSLIPAMVGHTLWNLAQFLFLSEMAGKQWQ